MGGTHSATAAISTWAAPFMMPAAFDYHAVDTVAEAADLLAKHGEDAKLLAGGQSLLAALKLRLAKPGILIDLGRLADLREIAFADGLKIGAMVDKLGVPRRQERFRRSGTLRQTSAIRSFVTAERSAVRSLMLTPPEIGLLWRLRSRPRSM